MSPVDPRIFGLTPEGGQAQTISNLKARMAMRERAGSSAGGGTGSVADATTTLKGKLKLGGDLDGTADLPRVRGLIDRELAAATSVGATTITVHTPPGIAANIGWIVVDAFTVQAEARRVTAVSGTSLTVPALTFAHAANDKVLFVEGDTFSVAWWGGAADSADYALHIQAAIDSLVAGDQYGDAEGIVCVPACPTNIYTCLTTISLKGSIRLAGPGQGTVLHWPNDLGVSAYGIDMTTADLNEGALSGFSLVGPVQIGDHKPTVKVITGATVAGGTTTFTATAHGLATGDRVLVVDVLMSGGTNTGVNGHHIVTAVPTADTFSVAVTTTSTTYASGGIAICPLVRMNGVNCLSGGVVENMRIRGFFAGLIPRDKVFVQDVHPQGNFYGAYFSVANQGDMYWSNCVVDSNRMASFATTGGANVKGIGSHAFNCHLGDGPYCLYLEPTDNYFDATFLGGAWVGSALEGYGNAVLWGDRKDGSLTSPGTGRIFNCEWIGMGDAAATIGSAGQTISQRPQTWGYRCYDVNNWFVASPWCFQGGSTYSTGLFDIAAIFEMEVRGADTTFDGLGANKLLRDGCDAVGFELTDGDERIHVRIANAAITVGDLLEPGGSAGAYRVQPCTTGVPVGVAKTATSASVQMVAMVVAGRAVPTRTTIASSAGNLSRLIPDTANAGKVKAAVAATDADQVGVASNNSNGTTIETRLGGFGSGGGGLAVDPTTNRLNISHTATDLGNASGSIYLAPSSPWDVSASPAGTFWRMLMYHNGFAGGANERSSDVTNATSADTPNDPTAGTATFWFPQGGYFPFSSRGGLCAYQVDVEQYKPTGATFPTNTYNETRCYVGGMAVQNAGANTASVEFATTVQSPAFTDGGPARARTGIFSMTDKNLYSDYNSTAPNYFNAASAYRRRGSINIDVNCSSGAGYSGTGIVFRGAGATGESAPESAFKRALVLENRTGGDIFCLDGRARMGFGVSNSNTAGDQLPSRINLGYTNAGVASFLPEDGINFAGTIDMYRVAAGRLRIAGTTPANTTLDLFAASGASSLINLMHAGSVFWQIVGNHSDGRLIFRGDAAATTGDLLTLDRDSRVVQLGIVPTDNGAAQGSLAIQPDGAWDATKGGTVSASDIFQLLSMNVPGGFTNGLNDRLVVSDDDVTATDAPNSAASGTAATFWYPALSSYIFESKGTLVSHQADLTINKPTGSTFPNTYNEAGVFVGGTTVNSKGSNTRVVEGGVTVNRATVNFDGSGGASATPDAGPARSRGMIFSLTDKNSYASYNSTTIFGASSHYKDRGAVMIDMNNTGGDGYAGTGILFRGSGALQESSPVSGFKRIMVLEDLLGYDILTIDGRARMGFGACNNNTVGDQLTARINLGYTNAGATSTVAADGMNFGGDIGLYRINPVILHASFTSTGGMGIGSTASAGAGGAGVFNGSGGRVDVTRATGGVFVRGYDASAGTPERMNLGDGSSSVNGLRFGPGTGAMDTTLYRSAASTLKTDGTLIVASNLTAQSLLNITNSAGSGLLSFTSQGSAASSVASNITGVYVRNKKLVVKFNDAGTTRWYYLDMSATSNQSWIYSATDPDP